MSPATDDFDDDSDVPTEEIYLELQVLEAQVKENGAAPDLPSPVSADDPTGIKARIARLRAMLNDRGKPYEY